MPLTYAAAATIDAPPAVVWALLIDAPAYPEWNPTVTKVEGTVTPGSKLKVFAKISPNRAFPVKVTELVPEQRMVWTGGMPLGLFKGQRTFVLTAEGDAKTRFSMREVFTGLMSPLITKAIPDLQPTFDEFTAALKETAEKRATEAGG